MAVNLLEIFLIGFVLGLGGPCLFYCVPLIFAFTIGSEKQFKKSIIDILVFLSGRFLAYIILAFFAAISGVLLRNFIGAAPIVYFKPLAGLISIGLGLFVFLRKERPESGCSMHNQNISVWGGLFGLGFIIGISPCAPLVVLLSEIALLSKSIWDGVLYGVAFGLGTFIPAFIITAGLNGLFKQFLQKLFKSPKFNLALKVFSSLILILLGLFLFSSLFIK